MNDKKIIGLTGLYCAGKNYIAPFLEQRGLPVLDVDKLGHKVIEMEKERILARFGNDILDREGRIDRKLLGAKVFGRDEEVAALEDIVHPGANRETLAWISAQTGRACVINAALLHRSSVFNMLDAIIIVKAPFMVRLLRAKKRDKLHWSALLRRFFSQGKFSSQYLQKKTDIYIVENSGFFGFRERARQKKLEGRLDEILSREGILKV